MSRLLKKECLFSLEVALVIITYAYNVYIYIIVYI